MITETIKFTDFDGEEREEKFMFNLTKAELVDMNLTTQGGLEKVLTNIIESKDTVKIIEWFKIIIDKSYGIKSPDGRKFMKSKEILEDFKSTEAYSNLYIELLTNTEKASEFINGIIPKTE